MNQLTVGNIISNSFSIGLRNMASIVGAVVLWLITLWIPYLNVGTTIAMMGIVVTMSKGGVFSPTEIFDAKYRRNMGEIFLLGAFYLFGVFIGYIFVVIPGIVISIAWGQSIYLLIDKGLNPTEALTVSNRITYGKKWTIFFGYLLLMIIVWIAIGILSLIFGYISPILGLIISILGNIAIFSIMFACAAYIYGELSKLVDAAPGK